MIEKIIDNILNDIRKGEFNIVWFESSCKRNNIIFETTIELGNYVVFITNYFNILCIEDINDGTLIEIKPIPNKLLKYLENKVKELHIKINKEKFTSITEKQDMFVKEIFMNN